MTLKKHVSMIHHKSPRSGRSLHPFVHVVADVGPEEVEIAHVPVVAVQPFADEEHVRLVDPQHAVRRDAAVMLPGFLLRNDSRTAPPWASRGLVRSGCVVQVMGWITLLSLIHI